MGKRKAPIAPKKTSTKVPRRFDCRFCEAPASCSTTMDKEQRKGFIECSRCGRSWNCDITPLDKPIDVYYSWIDAAERFMKESGLVEPQQVQEQPLIRKTDEESVDVSHEPMPEEAESSEDEYVPSARRARVEESDSEQEVVSEEQGDNVDSDED
ncbi:hypothetical protein P9112_003286 [Eukaryota sp. TZLM1-RC]